MRWDHGGGAADGELVRAKGSRPPAKGFRLPVLRHGRLPPWLARRRRSAMASSSRAAMAASCRGSRAAGSRPPPPQSRHGLLLARPQRDLHLHFPSLLEKRKFWVRTLSLCMTQTDWICVLIVVGDSLTRPTPPPVYPQNQPIKPINQAIQSPFPAGPASTPGRLPPPPPPVLPSAAHPRPRGRIRKVSSAPDGRSDAAPEGKSDAVGPPSAPHLAASEEARTCQSRSRRLPRHTETAVLPTSRSRDRASRRRLEPASRCPGEALRRRLSCRPMSTAPVPPCAACSDLATLRTAGDTSPASRRLGVPLRRRLSCRPAPTALVPPCAAAPPDPVPPCAAGSRDSLRRRLP